MSNKTREALIFVIGFTVIAGGWIALVYGLLGYFDREGQRWAATGTIAILLPLAIVITRWLSMREAKAHVSGIDKGIEKVSKVAQETASIRATLHTTIKPLAQPGTSTGAPARSQWDDLLPRPEQGAIIVSRSSNDNTRSVDRDRAA